MIWIKVIENFISNAIKYSDQSKNHRYVKIDYSVKNGHSVLSIKDNGLGIEKKYQKDLFGMFKRFHTESSFGSGLGLYLVKKHLKKMNAHVEFESAKGKGSTFRVILNNTLNSSWQEK